MIASGDFREIIESALETKLTEHATFIATQYRGQIAVAGFDNFTGDDIEIFIVSDGAGWANRQFLKTCFSYVFDQCGCMRCTGRVVADNQEALEMDRRLGFVEEGRLRNAKDGKDIVILGMLKQECRWIDG